MGPFIPSVRPNERGHLHCLTLRERRNLRKGGWVVYTVKRIPWHNDAIQITLKEEPKINFKRSPLFVVPNNVKWYLGPLFVRESCIKITKMIYPLWHYDTLLTTLWRILIIPPSSPSPIFHLAYNSFEIHFEFCLLCETLLPVLHDERSLQG